MALSHNTTVFIILCAIVITITAVPIPEEETESNGQYGEIVEGDMLLTKEQQDEIYNTDNTDINTRNGLRPRFSRWPQATVVYKVEGKFDDSQMWVIKNAMADIMNKSCVKFRPLGENENIHALIINNEKEDCFTSVGYSKSSKNQLLNLGKGCFYLATVLHELLHSLGFLHMQSTYNRDNYVIIKWENIIEKYKFNFNKFGIGTVDDYGVEYDYNSVMHYARDAFSSNGKDTIVAKQKNVKVGPGTGLTEKDILKLNKMYCGA